MTILALETSCDETAVAILRGSDRHSGSELLASEVASQIAEHEKFGGVVPEVASRNHLVHAPRLLERAKGRAKIDMLDVDAFAATSGPGLASSLMIGASIAKGLAIAQTCPRKEGVIRAHYLVRGRGAPEVLVITDAQD